MRSALVVLALVVTVVVLRSGVALAGDGDEPGTDPAGEVLTVLEASRSRFAPCAYALGAPSPELASLTLVVRVDARGRAATEIRETPSASRSLRSCLSRGVSGVVSRMRPRPVGPVEVELRPFSALPQPSRAPAAPIVASRDDVVSMDRSLAEGADDAQRLSMLSSEIENGRAVPASAAPLYLRRFRERTMEAALLLCGMTVGEGARATIERALPANQRAYFHGVTESGCGAASSEVVPTPPRHPGAQCSSNSDCVMIPRSPPDCCGNPCTGGDAVPRVDAERLGRACEAVRPRHCPAMACMFEPSYAACVQGRCVTRSEGERGGL